MSPLLLSLAAKSAHFHRRMSYGDSMGAQYPRDYYRPCDRRLIRYLCFGRADHGLFGVRLIVNQL